MLFYSRLIPLQIPSIFPFSTYTHPTVSFTTDQNGSPTVDAEME